MLGGRCLVAKVKSRETELGTIHAENQSLELHMQNAGFSTELGTIHAENQYQPLELHTQKATLATINTGYYKRRKSVRWNMTPTSTTQIRCLAVYKIGLRRPI